MRAIFFICVLIPFCAAQWAPPNLVDTALKGVQNARKRVEDIMSNVERSSRTLKLNTDREIGNLNSQSFSRISDINTRRQNDIKKEIEEAKAAGNSAAVDCLNLVASNMRSAYQNGHSELNNCKRQGEQLLANDLAQFDAMKATGQRLVNQINLISTQCFSSDSWQMVNCITTKVASANIEIRQYENSANQLIQNANSIKNKITLSVNNCNSGVANKVSSASMDAIYATSACLKN